MTAAMIADLLESRDKLVELMGETVCHNCRNRIAWKGDISEVRPHEKLRGVDDWRSCMACFKARAALKQAGEWQE
jgi:hypothetical protein